MSLVLRPWVEYAPLHHCSREYISDGLRMPQLRSATTGPSRVQSEELCSNDLLKYIEMCSDKQGPRQLTNANVWRTSVYYRSTRKYESSSFVFSRPEEQTCLRQAHNHTTERTLPYVRMETQSYSTGQRWSDKRWARTSLSHCYLHNKTLCWALPQRSLR